MKTMSTPKHTPGPWRTFTSPNGIATDATLYGSNGEVIGHIGDIHSPQVTKESIARDEANARLIAASPELLEACKAAVAALSQPVQFTQPDQRVFDNRPVEILRGDAKFARETLQAAIDKATKGEAEPEPNEQEANYDLHASDGLD